MRQIQKPEGKESWWKLRRRVLAAFATSLTILCSEPPAGADKKFCNDQASAISEFYKHPKRERSDKTLAKKTLERLERIGKRLKANDELCFALGDMAMNGDGMLALRAVFLIQEVGGCAPSSPVDWRGYDTQQKFLEIAFSNPRTRTADEAISAWHEMIKLNDDWSWWPTHLLPFPLPKASAVTVMRLKLLLTCGTEQEARKAAAWLARLMDSDSRKTGKVAANVIYERSIGLAHARGPKTDALIPGDVVKKAEKMTTAKQKAWYQSILKGPIFTDNSDKSIPYSYD